MENVFHPGEIVGYEMMEGFIMYAMIMHPILPEGFDSFDDIPQVNLSYKILTSPEDEEVRTKVSWRKWGWVWQYWLG